MIITIFKREIIDLVSFKLCISIIIIIFASLFGAVLSVDKFERRLNLYNNATFENEEKLKNINNLDNLIYHKQNIHKKPKTIEIFVGGREDELIESFTINFFQIFLPETKLHGNFNFFKKFIPVDWVFITSFIISLLTLIITFDSISKEKESLILSFLFSYPLKKSSFLIAKYLSRMAIIFLFTILGFLIYSLTSILSTHIGINADLIGRLLIILSISLFLISLLILISILISLLTKSSTLSIIVLVLLWIFLIIIIPSSVKLIVQLQQATPSIDRVKEEIGRFYDNAFYSAPKELHGMSMNPYSKVAVNRNNLMREIFQKMDFLFDKYINDYIYQASFIAKLSRISFISNFVVACENISNVGFNSFQIFYKDVKFYKEILKNFVIEKDKMDVNSPHLPYALFNYSTVSNIKFSSSIIPRFGETRISFSTSLKNSLIDILLLLVLNIIIFYLCYLIMIKYDVR